MMEIDNDPLEGSSYDLGVTVKAEIKEEEEDENYNTMVLKRASDRVARPLRLACERHGDCDAQWRENNNKKALFSSREDEMLIELIYRNPPIYDARVESYKDNMVRDNIWEEIGKALKKPSYECRKRWKYIRDSYSRCKRKNKRPTGSRASSKTTKWLLFERLQFLDQIPIERKNIATVQDNYIIEEYSVEWGRKSGGESSNEEVSNEGLIDRRTGKAGTSGLTITTEERGDEIAGAGTTELKMNTGDTNRENTSNKEAIGAVICEAETIELQFTAEDTTGVGPSNQGASEGDIGKARTDLKMTTEETSREQTSNKVVIGGGIRKARTNRIQRKRKRQPGNNLHTALLKFLKERDEQRKERMRTLTAQEPDEINSFCSHVGSILRKLSPRRRIEAKTEVFNVLAGYELRSLDQEENTSSFSPHTDSNITYSSGTVASPTAVDPTDVSGPLLKPVAPGDSNNEGCEVSTEFDNNYFFSSM